jgi:nucleotide-binding universal stress UspA family protein
MFPPKKILFPVDFSERCASAARMVEIFAGQFQAEVTLLHIIEPLSYNDIPVDSSNIAEQRLGSFLVEELKHFNVNRVLTEGDPTARILECAHAQSVDLIMMPTHGYGPFRRLLLGSVTAKVLHDAECPVWTGVHMEQVPSLENIHIKRMVCALDLEAQSCPTASWGKKLACEFGAELTIVHAVTEARPTTTIDEVRQDLIDAATERIQAVQACVGSEARVFVKADDVAPAVCGCAAEQNADLLVIGRSVKTGVLGRLRANAYSIIRQAPCPVISV